MKTYPHLFSATCLLALLASPLTEVQASCTPEHAAMGHCTLDAPKTETVKSETESVKPEPAQAESKSAAAPMAAGMACTPEHAAMGHCKMDEPKAEQPKEKSKAKKPKKAKKKASSAEKVATSERKPLTAASTACTPEHAAMGHCTLDAPKADVSQPVANTRPTAKPVVQAAKACTPEHAAMGHCTLDTPKKQAAPRVTAKPVAQPAKPAMACAPEHAAMGHCTMPSVKPAPKVAVQAKAAPKSANTCTPEHAAMGHCTMDSGLPVSDGSAETNIPMPYHDAMMDMNDDPLLHKVMIDRFEIRDTQHGKPVILEADAWFGKSLDKLWLKTDLEAVDGELEEAQVQVLYNHAISPFWDMQAGGRRDFKPAQRTWAALGVHGTAPYFIDTNASLFLGKSGQAALSLSAEKELMLTQKTVLIPELALRMYAKDDHELGVGAGLSDLNLGLRLSHEIKREFAPYIGVNWSKKFGKTADMAEHHGEKTQDTQFLVGIKAWF